MTEFSPGVYYVVGFEGKSDGAVVTFGSAALVRDGKLINAALSGSRTYPGPLSELDEFVKNGSIERIDPTPIPDWIGEQECYILRVMTGGPIGAFIYMFPDKRELTMWSDSSGWTYYLFSSFDACDHVTEKIAERLLDWLALPGHDEDELKTGHKAARILDHRIGTYELLVGMSSSEEELAKLVEDMPERNRAPARLRAKIHPKSE